MRKWKVATAVVGLLVVSMATVASAQSRRGRQNDYYYEDDYGREGQNFNRGAQAQRSNRQATNERYYARRVPGQTQSGNSVDRQLASWLLVDNRGEIQLAKLAHERASCDDVQEFAEKLIDDHAQMVEDLQQFAGRGRSSRQANENETGYDRNDPYRQASSSNRGSQQLGGLNIVRLKQQLGQQCVASAEEELEQKDGDEFDKCYIGMQIAKHMEMLDTLKVFSRYASPELDELIEQAEQTTEDHLEHAKQLIKQLEEESSGSSSRSATRSSRSRDESSATSAASSNRENRRNRATDEEK